VIQRLACAQASQHEPAFERLSPLSDQIREVAGGPREGSGGAVSDAMCAAAMGCNTWAKGEVEGSDVPHS
jgi:hypothetical protein